MASNIPFVDLKAQYERIRPAVDERIRAVLEHGRFILGPEVAALEEALAAYCGCAHAIGVSSGTDALLATLMAEGIGPGDAVFLPAFTFPATAEVVVTVGARPVFVDVDPRTFNIVAEDLEARVQMARSRFGLRPRAVITVDLFGLPADYPRLREVASQQGLYLIADAAQSFGASLEGVRVGGLGDATAVSFFPAKPLGCYGDGGAVLTNDAERAGIYRSIRAHGKASDKYDIVRPGLNARLDTLQAAILLAKLDVFPAEHAAREAVAQRYDAALDGLFTVPMRPPGATSAWAQYALLTDRREAVRAHLAAAGIPTMVYYPRPVHRQPAFAPHHDGFPDLPVSDDLCTRILCLPMHPYLDPETQDLIIRSVAEVSSAASA